MAEQVASTPGALVSLSVKCFCNEMFPCETSKSQARTSDLKQTVTSCSISVSIMEQDIYSDGSDRMERMLLFAFLAESSGCEFREQLPFLQSQGILCSVKNALCYDSDGELQTDGNRSGHLQNGELVPDPEVNEAIVHNIAAQLAEIGDQLDKQIKAKVVNDLVQHFLNENLPREEITRCLSQAVEGLARAIPSDLEQEKAMLVLAMLLTKKVANQMPSLLQRVFSTTVNYISQHLHNYVVRMIFLYGPKDGKYVKKGPSNQNAAGTPLNAAKYPILGPLTPP
ncbi:hypothetical protein CIB84_003371 [Bambusicola thoracicus]|uniref:BH3-interacting domain death agonist n=1 Tax=Bambusicola thoracicus TaxID=9083 RepID=A0A2P4T957_BAMTH|nr:hypothetical protein CIB84_003371 [Bambusicola thoracicus]